jgi:hypothetical protein
MTYIINSSSCPEQSQDAKGLGWQEAGSFLNLLSDAEYWPARLPSEEDLKITKICELYRQLSPKERVSFEKMLTQKGYFLLHTYSTRMAMLGARKKEEIWLIYGIVALTIGWASPDIEWIDWRETLISLAPLYHSACLVGEPRQIFEAGVRHVDDERIRNLILGFLDRDPRDQRLEAMGCEAIEGPSGLIYRFGKQPIPEGHL